MAPKSGTDPLQALPNIGAEVASRLRKAGIATPEELRALGSVEAVVRLEAVQPDNPPCRSMLAGLEGAIRGVRWHAIPKDERDRLWKEFEAHNEGRASLTPAGSPRSLTCRRGAGSPSNLSQRPPAGHGVQRV